MKTWKIRKGDGDFMAVKCIETKDGRTFSYDICCMDNNYYTHENKENNARLIAAAPELLAVLESMLVVYESLKEGEQEWHHYERDVADAHAVIAKAKGKVETCNYCGGNCPNETEDSSYFCDEYAAGGFSTKEAIDNAKGEKQ